MVGHSSVWKEIKLYKLYRWEVGDICRDFQMIPFDLCLFSSMCVGLTIILEKGKV